MPKDKKQRQAAISRWISETMRKWESTGRIGKADPKRRKKAHEMAIAIAMNKVGGKKK